MCTLIFCLKRTGISFELMSVSSRKRRNFLFLRLLARASETELPSSVVPQYRHLPSDDTERRQCLLKVFANNQTIAQMNFAILRDTQSARMSPIQYADDLYAK